ncbi:NIPSNAP family protein [Sphingobium sp.]|uniref:NIPSNAP family protein n=1 Tax=Sphingobium sp. TaxID=1912891 RepID=UPI0028BE67C2|nr:NIPSNAP family protein [Sphingobium sp.]
MIYEIRLYTVVPGRLDVAYRRFQHHLPALFERHGVRNVGRWTASAGPNGPMYVYMMAYRDLGERERQWQAFYGDADWHEVRAATQGTEEATERFDLFFLRTMPGWTFAALPDATVGGLQELIFAEVALGRQGDACRYITETYLPAIREAGGTAMLAADFVSGANLPRVALLVDWADAAARQAGWRQLQANDDLYRALAAQRAKFGRALLGRTDTYLLEPTPFDLPRQDLGQGGGK